MLRSNIRALHDYLFSREENLFIFSSTASQTFKKLESTRSIKQYVVSIMYLNLCIKSKFYSLGATVDNFLKISGHKLVACGSLNWQGESVGIAECMTQHSHYSFPVYLYIYVFLYLGLNYICKLCTVLAIYILECSAHSVNVKPSKWKSKESYKV